MTKIKKIVDGVHTYTVEETYDQAGNLLGRQIVGYAKRKSKLGPEYISQLRRERKGVA